MYTRRSAVVRIAASVTLAAVAALGAQAFVPTAFGCSQVGGGNCREAQPGTEPTIGLYVQLRMLVDGVVALLP